MIDDKIELLRHYDEDNKPLTVTIFDYNNLVSKKDKNAISDFIFHRLHCRYLLPFEKTDKKFKNGFSIMANCCLLIETLQSFKNGWEDTRNKSEQAFKGFLTTDKNFEELKKLSNEFYKNVRCGILHQGETTGGWTINRKGGKNIYDSKTKTIDAIRFSQQLKLSLKEYSQSLKQSDWDEEIWDNFRVKMRKVISNCAT